MQIVNVYSPPVDPYLLWQAENSAAFCNRMSATITAVACEINQQKTGNDCRCNGCSGLHNQAPLLQLKPFVMICADKMTAPEPDTPPGSASGDSKNDSFAALDEIIDGLYDDPAPGDDFYDVELDLDDEALLELFPELASEKNDETEKRFTEYQEAAPRYAVYQGRCKKCGGYVENYREWHDDNCFRCLACGWRTGVDYESNRAIKGGDRGQA